MAFKPSTKVSKRPYKKRAAKRTAGVGKAVKQYVKRALGKEIEMKNWINYGVNQAINTAIATTPTYVNLTPTPPQGITKSTRIGNEVIVKRAVISGYVNLLPYNNTTNLLVAPVMVKMWLCSARQLNTNNLALTGIANNFFDVVSSSVGFQGNMLDMLLTPNKEVWKIHATKQFQLGLTNNPSNPTVGSDNSKFSHKFSFSFAKHLGKLKWDDSTSNIVTNRNLFLVFQPVYPDGSTAAISVAEYHHNTRIDYHDA